MVISDCNDNNNNSNNIEWIRNSEERNHSFKTFPKSLQEEKEEDLKFDVDLYNKIYQIFRAARYHRNCITNYDCRCIVDHMSDDNIKIVVIKRGMQLHLKKFIKNA